MRGFVGKILFIALLAAPSVSFGVSASDLQNALGQINGLNFGGTINTLDQWKATTTPGGETAITPRIHARPVYAPYSSTTISHLHSVGSATSTFANGIQLQGGCFQLPSGDCAGSGSSLWNDLGSWLEPLDGEGIIVASSTITDDLTVVGDIDASTVDATTFFVDGLVALNRSGTTLRYGFSASVLQQSFYTNALERLTIANGGNVGIGTTTPGAFLGVNGSALLNGDITLANVYATGTGQFDTALKVATTSLSANIEAEFGGQVKVSPGGGIYIGNTLGAAVGLAGLTAECSPTGSVFGFCVFGDQVGGDYAYFRLDGDLQFSGDADRFVEPNTYAFRYDSSAGVVHTETDLGLYFDGAGNNAGYTFVGSQGIDNPLLLVQTNIPGSAIRDAVHITSVFQVSTTTIYGSGDADTPGIVISVGPQANASTTPTEPFTVVPRSFFNDTVRIVGTTTSDIISLENNEALSIFTINQHGQTEVAQNGSATIYSECGSGATVDGGVNSGFITIGSGATTTCKIQYPVAYATNGNVSCDIAQISIAGARIFEASSTSEVLNITANNNLTAGDRIQYKNCALYK